jgi:hypothetical protein
MGGCRQYSCGQWQAVVKGLMKLQISWIREKLLASQEGLSSVQSLIYTGCSFYRLIRRPEHLHQQTLVSPCKLKVIHSVIT